MEKIRILVILFLFSIILVSQPGYSQQIKSFEISNEVLRIGQNENGDEYIFTGIRDLIVSSDGRIFVSDASNPSIRVFSDVGKFLYQIGRRGRGPGEFFNIMSITFSNDSTLIVSDRMLDRISEFSLDGVLLNTYLLPKSSFGTLQFAASGTNKDQLLIIMSDFVNSDKNGNIIYFFDTKKSEIESKSYFDVYEKFYDISSTFEQQFSVSPQYKINLLNNNRIGILSYLDNGLLGLFELANRESSYFGEADIQYYTLLNDNRSIVDIAKEKPGAGSIGGQKGNFKYLPRGLNRAIVGNEKYILRFYQRFTNPDDIYSALDIYRASNMELLSTSRLENLNVNFLKEDKNSITPHFLSDSNLLYTMDYYNLEEPVIRVFEIEINE